MTTSATEIPNFQAKSNKLEQSIKGDKSTLPVKHGVLRSDLKRTNALRFQPLSPWSGAACAPGHAPAKGPRKNQTILPMQKSSVSFSRFSAKSPRKDLKRKKQYLPLYKDYRKLASFRGFAKTRKTGIKRRRFETVREKPSADQFCLVSVKKTKNNTHCSIHRLFGNQKTLWTTSGGQVEASSSKSNGRRKSRFSQRMVFKAAVEKLLGLGFKYLVIHCAGRAISKRYVFRNFYRRFRIVLLKDFSAVAHNGCRPRSVRRV